MGRAASYSSTCGEKINTGHKEARMQLLSYVESLDPTDYGK